MKKAYIAIDKKRRESLKALYKSIHISDTFYTSKPVLVIDEFLKTVQFLSYSEMDKLDDVEQMTNEELESLLFAHYTGELERDYQLRTF